MFSYHAMLFSPNSTHFSTSLKKKMLSTKNVTVIAKYKKLFFFCYKKQVETFIHTLSLNLRKEIFVRGCVHFHLLEIAV